MNIAFVAYSPLGRRFLTGQIKIFDDFEEGDYRRNSPRFQGENFNKNLELVKIEVLAPDKGCIPSQFALAWVLAQGDFIFPIPGTKKVKYLEENTAASEIKLSPEELEQINKAFPENAAVGLRYPEAMMKSVNQ